MVLVFCCCELAFAFGISTWSRQISGVLGSKRDHSTSLGHLICLYDFMIYICSVFGVKIIAHSCRGPLLFGSDEIIAADGPISGFRTARRHCRGAVNSIYKSKLNSTRIFHELIWICHEINIKYLPCSCPVASASPSWATRTCTRTCELGLYSLNYSCYIHETIVSFFKLSGTFMNIHEYSRLFMLNYAISWEIINIHKYS